MQVIWSRILRGRFLGPFARNISRSEIAQEKGRRNCKEKLKAEEHRCF